MKGEYYTFSDAEVPCYTGSKNVFGVGNVVTGQGNIRVSLVHSKKVTSQLIADYMGVGDGNGDLSRRSMRRPKPARRPMPKPSKKLSRPCHR